MKFVSHILLCAFAITALGRECIRYHCQTFEEQKCANIEVKDNGEMSIGLMNCAQNKLCDIQGNGTEFFCRSHIKRRYPGEYCTDNEDCLVGSCDNAKKVCTGKPEGAACTEDLECDVGFFCNVSSNICSATAKVKESCIKAKCDAGLVCNNTKCIKMASVPIGNHADIPSACKSFYINSTGLCDKGPVLKGNKESHPVPIACTDKCQYEHRGASYNEVCTCGRTPIGNEYCNPGFGEYKMEPLEEYVNEYFEAAAKEPKKTLCHVSRGVFCLYKDLSGMGLKYYRAFVLYNNMTRWNIYYNNSDCLKKTLDSDYWYSAEKIQKEDFVQEKFGLYLFLGIAIAAIVIIAILLLVIYLRKGKGDETTEDEAVSSDKLSPN